MERARGFYPNENDPMSTAGHLQSDAGTNLGSPPPLSSSQASKQVGLPFLRLLFRLDDVVVFVECLAAKDANEAVSTPSRLSQSAQRYSNLWRTNLNNLCDDTAVPPNRLEEERRKVTKILWCDGFRFASENPSSGHKNTALLSRLMVGIQPTLTHPFKSQLLFSLETGLTYFKIIDVDDRCRLDCVVEPHPNIELIIARQRSCLYTKWESGRGDCAIVKDVVPVTCLTSRL